MKARHPFVTYIRTRYSHATQQEKRFLKLAALAVAILLPAIIIAPTWTLHRQKMSSLYLYTPQENLSPGQTFTLELRLSTGSSPVNAVGTVLYYDTSKFSVLTMDTEQSFCSFYTENSFDTIKGTVRIACGTPTPGFTGDSTIVKLSMRVRNGGPTEIYAKPEETMVLANDGHETNLLLKTPKLSLTPNLL